MVVRKSIELSGRTLTIETGRMAKQADGAVVVSYGDTVVLVTAVAAEDPSPHLDFFPLSVEYREKTYSAGKIPGGFIKREGRPSDKEILSARLIDRPIRPLFPDGFQNETQIIANVLSMDKENDADVLAGLGSATALGLSNIPFNGPIATVRVAKIDGEYVINPTITQIKNAELELVVAGSDDSIMMVEGEAKEVSEDDLLTAIDEAHKAIKKLTALQRELFSELKIEKRAFEKAELPEGLEEKVTELTLEGIKKAVRIAEKSERRQALKAVRDLAVTELEESYPESAKLIAAIIHDIEKVEVRSMIINDNVRLDGRGLKDIREITSEVGLLPRAHGSALFTRGQTQSLGVVTLGTKQDEQTIDGLAGETSKKYLLHYNFPPFSTGEAKPIRGVSRREIGHGNLAERALKPLLPEDGTFPYTIRIVSEVLESNGSSSMATVCSGSLSLMDAGVPVKGTVAGIAMGLIKEDSKIAILSDILGDEDHLGDMDFKVAGSKNGITAVQMDIKIDGISKKIMADALNQAKEGRAFIMGKMEEVLNEPRKEMSRWAPKIMEIYVPTEKIGTIIGPGGKTIRGIIEVTGVSIDIDDTGKVVIASDDTEAAEKALKMVNSLIEEPVVGKAYKGTVKRVKDFGAFVEFMPNKEGMVHISELDVARTNKVTDIVKEGDEIDVVVKGISPDGKIALSRREFLKRQNSSEKQ
ncbi:MAG: polyribonucleotide nucleotidyltransferase [Calditrichaceae bacterium]